MKHIDFLKSLILSGGEGGGGGGGLIPAPEGYTQYETQRAQLSINWLIGRQANVSVEKAIADKWSVGDKICLKAPYQISGVTQGNGAVWGTVASKPPASDDYVSVNITVAGSFVTPTVAESLATPLTITENKTGYIFGAGKYRTEVPSTVELYTDRTFTTIPSVNTRWNPSTQMNPIQVPVPRRGYVYVGTYNGDNYIVCGVGVSYHGSNVIMVRGVTKIEGGAPTGYYDVGGTFAAEPTQGNDAVYTPDAVFPSASGVYACAIGTYNGTEYAVYGSVTSYTANTVTIYADKVVAGGGGGSDEARWLVEGMCGTTDPATGIVTLMPFTTDAETIRAYAFYDTKMATLTLTGNIMSVGAHAFDGCVPDDGAIHFTGITPPAFDPDAFGSGGHVERIIVPSGCISAYEQALQSAGIMDVMVFEG